MLGVCLALDFFEYLLPPLMIPLVGDFIDLAGALFCVIFFGWFGVISLLELVPGLDALPVFTVTWLIWYVFRRRRARMRIEHELDRWR